MQAFRVLMLSAASAALMGGAAMAQSPAGAPPPTPMSQPYAHRPHAHQARVPRELKIVWRQEIRGQLKSLPPEERRGWMRHQWASMSDGQRQAKLAELQAKWDAMPPRVRTALLDRAAAHQEARRAKRAAMNGGPYGDEQGPPPPPPSGPSH